MKYTDISIGDCWRHMTTYPSDCISCIATDPPFNTGKDWGAFKDTWKEPRDNEYELLDKLDPPCVYVADAAEAAHSEAMANFITFMGVRLVQMHRILQPLGSIYIHCDPTASPYIRLMMDAIFRKENFRNEIVWAYGLGGSSPNMYSRKHDTILFYTKTDDYYFDKPSVPATSQMMKGQMKGQTDVITDIPSLNNMSGERTGYPTQKPVALYERLIKASCPRGGYVLDPFCGSGTTMVAANNLGRKPLGIDINPDAVEIATRRLQCAM